MMDTGPLARSDKTILVLLPGMDGTGILFAPLLRELSPSISPWVVPFPSDQPLSYDDLLPLVRQALPAGEPFFLLAESFSGPLAIKIAAEEPENLMGLILISTFIRNPVPWLPSCARHLAAAPLFRLARRFILIKALLSGYGNRDMTALLDAAHSQVKAEVMAKRAKEILAVNVKRELKNIKVPLHYLGGEKDRVVPEKNLKEIKAARPDLRARLIPGPHLVLQVNPRGAALEIARILLREKTI